MSHFKFKCPTVTLNVPNELSLKAINLKLTMLLALTSAARALEIAFLDIKDLDKHSYGYTFHFAKSTKTSKKLNLGILSNFILLKKTTICVYQHVDLNIKSTKEMQEQNKQLLLSFVKLQVTVSTPKISRWIMIALYLSGINTKIFTGHSTRTTSSSKDRYQPLQYQDGL